MDTTYWLMPDSGSRPTEDDERARLGLSKASNYILLVEDNEDDIELTLLALEAVNLANDVVVCRDGAEAQDFLFGMGSPEKPDPRSLPQVILLDINLPKVNGLNVLKALRAHERTKLVPVVMLSTSREERDLIESYASGANSYIQKAFDFNDFAEVMRQLGLYWLVLNEVPWKK